MTRFDIAPARAMRLSWMNDLDSHLYVPMASSLGVDDSFAMGPRRYMAIYLRGMLGEYSRVFADRTRCARAINSEHFVQNNMIQSGLPTRHSPMILIDRYGLDEENQLHRRSYRL